MDDGKYIVKSNKLIESKGKMTVLEQKIFLSLVSQISIDDKDFKEYKIPTKKFIELIGSKHSTKIYDDIHSSARRLMNKILTIETDETIMTTALLSSVETPKGKGIVKITFHPFLKPYLIDIQDRFTQYQLKNILNLTGSHSIRIYELLKQYEKIRKRKFEVEELKSYLGLENSYNTFKDFERRVLSPAKTEINEKTDIIIDYEKIRKGRRIGEIKFTIEPKAINEDQALMEALSSDQERMAIRVKCGFENEKFSDKQVMELYEAACKISDRFNIDPYAYIKLNHEYMQRQSDVKSRFAYLKKAIGEDFAGAVVKIVMGQKE